MLSRSYEFGLLHEDQNVKIEVKSSNGIYHVKIKIDGTEYDSKKKPTELTKTSFEFVHYQRGWVIQIGYEGDRWEG